MSERARRCFTPVITIWLWSKGEFFRKKYEFLNCYFLVAIFKDVNFSYFLGYEPLKIPLIFTDSKTFYFLFKFLFIIISKMRKSTPESKNFIFFSLLNKFYMLFNSKRHFFCHWTFSFLSLAHLWLATSTAPVSCCCGSRETHRRNENNERAKKK